MDEGMRRNSKALPIALAMDIHPGIFKIAKRLLLPLRVSYDAEFLYILYNNLILF
jgi:hypothetical protein